MSGCLQSVPCLILVLRMQHAILKVNNNHNRQPIIASLSDWEVYNLNSWQREKLAQSLGVMVHGEPVGHDCYLTQGKWASAAESRYTLINTSCSEVKINTAPCTLYLHSPTPLSICPLASSQPNKWDKTGRTGLQTSAYSYHYVNNYKVILHSFKELLLLMKPYPEYL